LQANPNKTKEKGLDFLGFLWPNPDFSTGYSRKNKKNFPPLNSPPGLRSKAASDSYLQGFRLIRPFEFASTLDPKNSEAASNRCALSTFPATIDRNPE
jgi:hypothetical protein